MQGLNFLLGNRSQLIVLRALHQTNHPLTGRAVERLTGLSNRATMLALETLVEARAVHREIDGRAHLHTINRQHYLVSKALRPAFNAEDQFWMDLSRTVQRVVKPRPIAAVATGPLTREETDYGGRLMLTMLFASETSRITSLKTIQKLAITFRDRYGLVLEHYLLDLNTMDAEEYEPLWKRVEREGILLFGQLP